MGKAQDYRNTLEEAYHTHWQNKVLLHPDVERAKRLLAEGTFLQGEDICREILMVEYSEEVPHETAEDFDELSWESILDDVFASNTAKGIQMWRSLLNIAEPSLKTDAKTAEKLLPDWDWLDSPSHDQVLLLLTALNDDRFVSQLFESASIGRLQYDVLNACRDCGQEKKGQHMLGHVSAATTLDIYTHITDDMRLTAAANIDRGIGKAVPQGDASEPGRETAQAQAEKPRMTDFKPYVGRKRKSGTGCVTEINDHLFEGRYSPKWLDGKKHARNVYAHTLEECEEKLKTLIEEMKAEIAEAQRQKAEGTLTPQAVEKSKKKGRKKAKQTKKKSKRK